MRTGRPGARHPVPLSQVWRECSPGWAVLSSALALAGLGCGDWRPPPHGETAGVASAISPEGDLFVDRAAEVGLDFVHRNGMSGQYYFAEMMGAGVALFDADADGDLDAYFVQGGPLADGAVGTGPSDRLYRNELVPTGTLRFVDVTAGSGVGVATGYGMGVAAADYDNDGHVDLYLTNFGPNQLLRNRGDGTFEDVTGVAGVDDPRWSVAAVFFDYDRDGRLDLYVGNYVDFRLGTHKRCFDAAGAQDYCAPSAYRGLSDRLFHNRGDGSFDDASPISGVGTLPGPGLGALAADFDRDGFIDLYVANDGAPNFLWRNLGGEAAGAGTFEETALLAGCAVDEDGRPQASMGVAFGDADDDGDGDLFMSHLSGETNTLFAGYGAGEFRDATPRSGLGAASLAATGFGTAFLDYDNDGRLDLLVVNGAVKTIEDLASRGVPFPLHQRKLLFHNLGGGRFEDVSAAAGAAFELSEVGRGAAFGDVDNDGDVDVLVTHNNGPARLLLNRVGSARSWIGLRLVTGERDALGARVEVSRPGGVSLQRRAHTDGSYASASDPRVLVGLGDVGGTVDVQIVWSDGTVEAWHARATRRYHILRQGRGE